MKRGTRRSKRNQEKNKSIADKLLSNNETLLGDIPSDIKDIHFNLLAKQASAFPKPIRKLQYTCKGCRRSEAPVKRYKKIYWIKCECCEGWWHIECACVSKESADKFSLYNIDYTCASCVISSLPKRTEGNISRCEKVNELPVKTDHQSLQDELFPSFDISSPRTVVPNSEVLTPLSTPLNFIPSIIEPDTHLDSHTTHSPDNPISNIDRHSKIDSTPSEVLIVDNIKNPKELRNSTKILEKINKFEQFKDVQFAYSPPQGGIALHFRESAKVDEALKHWPSSVFNTGEVPHRTNPRKLNRVSYMKNVDTSLSEFQIRKVLDKIGIKTIKIKRLYCRYGKYPMPVVQIVHPDIQEKLAALEKTIPISFHKRNAYLEDKKSIVIRCYLCQRFGHIAKLCTYTQRCECCSRSDHLGEVCSSDEYCCANCSGNHKSSSNSCPIYLQHAGKYRLPSIC